MTSAQTDEIGQASPFILLSNAPERRDSPNRQAQWKSVKKRLRPQVIARDGYECRYCGTYCEAEDGSFSGQIDHVLPLCKGGANTLDNLVAACVPCNASKRDQIWTPNPQPETPRSREHEKAAHDAWVAQSLEQFSYTLVAQRWEWDRFEEMAARIFSTIEDRSERLQEALGWALSAAWWDEERFAEHIERLRKTERSDAR